VPDRNNPDQQTATPAEGVRIIGAEEAQAALTGEPPQRNDDTVVAPRLDLTSEESDDANDKRPISFPSEGPTWSAADTGEESETSNEATTGEVPPLQHWTEPPTGTVPAIFADDSMEHEALDDDLEAWAAVSGSQPRFRAEGADWADNDTSFDALSESGPNEKLGALSEEGPVDEEAEFAEALAAKRRPRARARARAQVPAQPRPQRAAAPNEASQTPGPAAGRDLPTAIMTAAIVVIVALTCFEIGRTATALLAAVIIGVATLEFCTTLQSKGMRPATLLALVAAVTMPLATKHYGTSAYPVYIAVVVIFSMLWFLWEVTPGRPLLGISSTVLSFAYIGGLGGFAGLLLAEKDGVGLIIGVVICTVAYDVFGFFVGSQFGRSRIAPSVSPNKTVAGTVGGMLASVILGVAVVGAIHPWTHKYGFALGVLVAIGAFLGDLCESMIKRDLNVKDFGALLPGHGGVLDRFDGLLFCLPIAYYLAVHGKLF
jgi:phosphatidate cytidylyltransferase